MLRGWFDAFRSDGGPTLYSYPNRTPVTEDIRNIVIYISFSTLFVAFLIVFPGIRKERLSTLIGVTVSLFVGAVILVSNYGTDWQVATATVSSPYRAFSAEKIFADVGVRIGLNSVNITLRASSIHNQNEEINFNERFTWLGATQIQQEYKSALVKGLPYPILTIAEYLSQDSEGFSWGRRYRMAGYYSNILLWAAFAMWLMMNLLLCAVPRYGAYTMQLTGGIMLFADAIYALLLPRKALVIPFEGGTLHFHFGWCFWLVLFAGIVAVLIGATVAVVDTLYPNKFSTILEVDYDTPYRYFVGHDAALKETAVSTVDMASVPGSSSALKVEPSSSGQRDAVGGGVDNKGYEDDDEDSEVETIINGKKAVSLKQFGKYAQKEANRRQLSPKSPVQAVSRKYSGMTSNGQNSTSDVNIDIQAAAAMW